MTREEFDKYAIENGLVVWSNEMSERAIKALEQEQYYKDLAESYEKTINKLTNAIAEQEPKTGRWIYHRDWEAEGECPYECSECGRAYDYEMNYCGYCGAKMEG